MTDRVTILGNSSATPTRERSQSGQYLHFCGKRFLIDCGEGTQNKLISGKLSYQKISHIFISHLHGDHFMGLFPLINTMGLQGRKDKLTIYSPPGLGDVFNRIQGLTQGRLDFDVEFIELDGDHSSWRIDHIEITAFLVKHRIPCYAYRFQEIKTERTLNVERCTELGIPKSAFNGIKAGEDWVDKNGRTYKNIELTLDPPPAKSYCYITDTLFSAEWTRYAHGATLLYHEATYLNDLVDKAHERFHATAREAAIFASKAEVNSLLIGHFSSKYGDLNDHLVEARKVFENTQIAEQGQTFEIR